MHIVILNNDIKICSVNSSNEKRRVKIDEEGSFVCLKAIPYFQSISKSTDFVCLSFHQIWMNEASTNRQKKSPEPCFTNAGLQQIVRAADRLHQCPLPSALHLYFWSSRSEWQIHNKFCCPSSSVICSHQSQEDSSQVALILLRHSCAQIDSHHLRFLHRQLEINQYTHQWGCR